MPLTNITIVTTGRASTSQLDDVPGNQSSDVVFSSDSLFFLQAMPYEIICVIFLDAIAPLVLSAFGIVSNIVIIIVYHRQGVFQDSCTVSLVGLATSDFCNCLFNFISKVMQIRYNFYYVFGGKRNSDVAYLYALAFFIRKPRAMFTMITCWITVYIGLERLVSVARPFHVKQIFTPVRSCVVIAVVYGLAFLLNFPNLSIHKLSYYKSNGTTFYGSEDSGVLPFSFHMDMSFVNSACLQSVCLFLIVVFNTGIIFKVNTASKFRKLTTGSSAKPNTDISMQQKDAKNTIKGSKSSSTKEDKLTRMMVATSLFLLVCMTPSALVTAISRADFEAGLFGTPIITITLTFIESSTVIVNSSCNILFYYVMSAKFKKEILICLPCGR